MTSKIKDPWTKRHPRLTILIPAAFISAAAALTLYLFAIPLATFTLFAADATRVLIEADATVLGFFGIIAIYLFTSLDARIDKLDDKIADPANKDRLHVFQKRLDTLVTTKRNITISIIIGLACLVISMFISIGAYGILSLVPDINATSTEVSKLITWQIKTAATPSIVAVLLLLISILTIFIMLIQIGIMSPHKEER